MEEIKSLRGIYFLREGDAVDFFNRNGISITNSRWKHDRQFIIGSRVFPTGKIGFWVVPILLKRERDRLVEKGELDDFVIDVVKEFYEGGDVL